MLSNANANTIENKVLIMIVTQKPITASNLVMRKNWINKLQTWQRSSNFIFFIASFFWRHSISLAVCEFKIKNLENKHFSLDGECCFSLGRPFVYRSKSAYASKTKHDDFREAIFFSAILWLTAIKYTFLRFSIFI